MSSVLRVDQIPAEKIIQLSHRSYIINMLAKFEMTKCNDKDTPMESKVRLSKSMCPTTPQGRLEMENIPYREAVGSLLWIANGTRPDVAYAVSQVARYMSNPVMEHWNTVKRIVRYLKGTMDLKLTYNGNKARNVIGFARGVLPVLVNHTDGDATSKVQSLVSKESDSKRLKVTPEIYVDADYAADVDSRRSGTPKRKTKNHRKEK